MRYLKLGLILFVLVSASCDKKTPDYSQIKLDDFSGKEVAFSSLEGQWIAVVFISPECPLSENYTLTLKNLQKEFNAFDAEIYYIFPGTFYHRPQIEQFVKLYKLPTQSIYYDPDYRLRDYCAATITPEVFVIDQLGVIHYRGAIDNWAITLGKQRQVISEHYLMDAISELRDNKKVTVAKTRAVGCIIE